MSVELWDYQQQLVSDIYNRWSVGDVNVLAVSSTGSGKTVIFSHILQNHTGASVAIAHRKELVSQMSLALARNEVKHRIIGPTSLIKACVRIHMDECGRTFYDANANCAAAGVDTLIRMDASDPWFKRVGLWVTDECHHLLRDNKWGKAASMFPNARGLGVTATPCRSDGKGLGRHADGAFDSMVLAPDMRNIIERGFLTDYRIFSISSHIDLAGVTISANGDFSPEKLRAAVHKSKIVGDVVDEYLKIAPGKLGVTFCVDVASCHEQADAFRRMGVPAEVVSAQSSDLHRDMTLRKFARGDIKQLINVDLFGEGFDLPAIEVVSMARPTWSFGLYSQQFGRALRRLEGKQFGTLIDHVGNVYRHGLPDAPQNWTLDRAVKTASTGETQTVMVRTCPECTATYSRLLGMTCPYCNFVNEPVRRNGPDEVEGVLSELTPETLARMRKAVDAVQGPPTVPYNASPIVVASVHKNHRLRLEAIEDLKQAMMLWASGREDIIAAQREFYLRFGIDVMTAQTLSRSEAENLTMRINQ